MNFTWIRLSGARVLFLIPLFAFSATSEAVSLHVAEMTPDRYEPILERHPFGPPPPATGNEEGGKEAGAAEEGETAAIIPEGLDKVKVTLLSRFHGNPAVGFTDGTDGRSYYLLEGQTFEDFTCEEVHFAEQTVTLRRSGVSAELPLWINPATTNCADVLAYGQPAGKLGVLPQPPAENKEAEAAREEMKERRRKAYEEFQERRRRNAEEMAALSPEDREKRLHEINTDLIINGGGPPLPIELNDEDLDKLYDAGFDVGKRPGRGRHRGSSRSRSGSTGESGKSASSAEAETPTEGAK
ncbi:MAG: hypothetical protein ACI4QT_06430 [Kiritimatiellia bacterium]